MVSAGNVETESTLAIQTAPNGPFLTLGELRVS